MGKGIRRWRRWRECFGVLKTLCHAQETSYTYAIVFIVVCFDLISSSLLFELFRQINLFDLISSSLLFDLI